MAETGMVSAGIGSAMADRVARMAATLLAQTQNATREDISRAVLVALHICAEVAKHTAPAGTPIS